MFISNLHIFCGFMGFLVFNVCLCLIFVCYRVGKEHYEPLLKADPRILPDQDLISNGPDYVREMTTQGPFVVHPSEKVLHGIDYDACWNDKYLCFDNGGIVWKGEYIEEQKNIYNNWDGDFQSKKWSKYPDISKFQPWIQQFCEDRPCIASPWHVMISNFYNSKILKKCVSNWDWGTRLHNSIFVPDPTATDEELAPYLFKRNNLDEIESRNMDRLAQSTPTPQSTVTPQTTVTPQSTATPQSSISPQPRRRLRTTQRPTQQDNRRRTSMSQAISQRPNPNPPRRSRFTQPSSSRRHHPRSILKKTINGRLRPAPDPRLTKYRQIRANEPTETKTNRDDSISQHTLEMDQFMDNETDGMVSDTNSMKNHDNSDCDNDTLAAETVVLSKLLAAQANDTLLAQLGFEKYERNNEIIAIDSQVTGYNTGVPLHQLSVNEMNGDWRTIKVREDESGFKRLIYLTGNPCKFAGNVDLTQIHNFIVAGLWGRAIKELRNSKEKYENVKLRELDIAGSIWLSRETCENFFDQFKIRKTQIPIRKSVTNQLFAERVSQVQNLDVWTAKELAKWSENENKRVFVGMYIY